MPPPDADADRRWADLDALIVEAGSPDPYLDGTERRRTMPPKWACAVAAAFPAGGGLGVSIDTQGEPSPLTARTMIAVLVEELQNAGVGSATVGPCR